MLRIQITTIFLWFQQIAIEFLVLNICLSSNGKESEGLMSDVGELVVRRSCELAALLSPSRCIQASQLIQWKEHRDSSIKVLLVGVASISLVKSSDVADGADSPLEFEE
jgi:hypothetical protein